MTGPDQVATVAALRRCSLKTANAADGRGVNGAAREARNALQHAGHDPSAAGGMADAAVAIGRSIQRAAQAAALQLSRGQ